MGLMGKLYWKRNFISSFRCILQRQFFYSTSATTEGPISGSTSPNSLSSLTNFLVGSLGFSEKNALSTSTKLTKLRISRGAKEVSGFNFPSNADLVISFLQQKGLEKPQIRFVVFHVPQILTSRIEQTLKPKMKILQDLGLSECDAAQFIATHPGILRHGLHSTIIPALETLRVLLGGNESVVHVIKGLQWNAYPRVAKDLVSNVSLLRARGIPLESIKKRIVQESYPFIRKTPVFKDILIQVEEKWGISPLSPAFMNAVRLLCCYREKTIESKFRVFESFGWNRSDVVHLFRRNHYCLMVADGMIKARLSFFMNELGYDPGYIVRRPALMSYDFERRVLPRHIVLRTLKEKGLIKENCPLYTALTYNGSMFLRKFVLPFKDVVPNLRDIYVNSIDSSAQQQGQRRSKARLTKTKLKPSQ